MPRNIQAPSSVIMVRPHHFSVNQETSGDNAFQTAAINITSDVLAKQAYEEVTGAVACLREHGIEVHVFEDESLVTPDSVFPNNWLSTHTGGHIAIYPMCPVSRRRERRFDIIEMLKKRYRVQDVVDYSGLEEDDTFLEGTGAMVLDHIERVAYAVLSQRTNPLALERFCSHFNYEPMLFEAFDSKDVPIYHTNVLMCVATEFVMICPDMIHNKKRCSELIQRFEESGREVITLSQSQIDSFAGNAIELQGKDCRYLALSAKAKSSLTDPQIKAIEKSASLLPLNVPTIEMSGGSVRCMLVGIHLSRR